MEGAKYLDIYFEYNNQEFLEILKLRHCLSSMLSTNSLVIYIRHLENIYKVDLKTAIKTLLLTIKFMDLERNKIKRLMPMKSINIKYFKLKKDSLEEMMIQKCVQLINQRLVSDERSLQRQLQILTDNVYHFNRKIQVQKSTYGSEAEYLYTYLEQQLVQLRLELEDQYKILQQLNNLEFRAFYDRYTVFCHHRRKLPKVKNRNLKYLEITKDMNSKIQRRKQNLKDTESYDEDKENQGHDMGQSECKEDEQPERQQLINMPIRKSILSSFEYEEDLN